jgi:hypothetical protein
LESGSAGRVSSELSVSSSLPDEEYDISFSFLMRSNVDWRRR